MKSSTPFQNLQNLHFSLNDNILWIIVILGMFAFMLSAFVYTYHWKNYGTNERFMKLVQTVYITVGVLLLLSSAVLIKIR